jgi:alkylhydroperoxidase family enzyme
MKNVAPRIAPAVPPFAEPVAAALSVIMPPGVPPLALFTTLARNERVFLRVMAGGLLDRGSISLREREIVIDRTCFRCGSEYEWGVHVAFFGPRAGFSEADVRALCAADPTTAPLPSRERLLLRLCDELHDRASVSDALWSELSAEWRAEQLVELVALAGYYHLISFLTNAFQLAPEPFAARFPARSR